jgi:hypothetical protein
MAEEKPGWQAPNGGFQSRRELDEFGTGLRGSQKRRFYSRRNVDRNEAIGREHVVLAALVDDADVSVPLGIFVEEDDVDLVPLERALVAVVVHADGEPAPSRVCLA